MIPIFDALVISLMLFSLKFIFLLLIKIFPFVGLSIIEIIFNSVDLPDPDGPTIE